ncbi:MAG TPA: nuclear transport factor 2 family protein [Pseudonocardiaceae bacterium]|nr:nuclear transport factor 2 family protein [Pseudonocardiaceae bacterium]
MTTVDITQYAAMKPYFDVITTGLAGLVDGEDFFDIHAEDVVIEYVITVPGYPRKIEGRDALAELYRNYGDTIVQNGSSDVFAYYDREKSVAVLEYTIHGTTVHNGSPYLNRFISVITIKDRKIVHWRDYLDPLLVLDAFKDMAPGNNEG